MQPNDGIPDISHFEGDIYLRLENLPAAEWRAHSHPWGQLNYVSQGIMNIEIEGQRFSSPPHYAVWIPPSLEHKSFSTTPSIYRSAYLSARISAKLPKEPCAISMSRLLKELLNECARRGVTTPNTPAEMNLSAVIIDEILSSTTLNSYLPYPATGLLKQVLDDVSSNLRQKRSTKEIAEKFHLTSRTLERKCSAELGIGFGEWQQRVRHMKAFEGLEEGRTVQQISWELGYSSPTVFINMFRRLTGVTPDQYRRSKS